MNMFPILSIANSVYSSPVPSKPLGYFSSAYSSPEILPHFNYLRRCKCRISALLSAPLIAKHMMSMVGIFRWSAPFKIFQSVILFVSILVVPPISFWVVLFKKCFKNNQVDITINGDTIPVQADVQISFTRCLEYNFFPVSSSWRAFNPSEVANEISLKTFYWTPFLHFCDYLFRHCSTFLFKVDRVQAIETARTVRSPSILYQEWGHVTMPL